MKKLFSMLLCLMLLVCSAAAESTIQVSGSGETFISADVATITLGVNARDKDVLEAQTQVNTAISAIRQALNSAGIASEDINTDCISIYPVYDYNDGAEQLTAYSVSSSLAIRTTDLAGAGSLIDLAFGAGANTLTGISFSADDTTEARNSSLTAAVADARAKADILAAAAGLKITGIRSVIENYSSSYDSGVGNFSRTYKSEEADSGTTVQADKLCVTVSVSVIFTAE